MILGIIPVLDSLSAVSSKPLYGMLVILFIIKNKVSISNIILLNIRKEYISSESNKSVLLDELLEDKYFIFFIMNSCNLFSGFIISTLILSPFSVKFPC